MTEQEDKMRVAKGPVTCGEIGDLLLAYLTLELGEKQSRLVREHLRACEPCRREAARLEAMAKWLRVESGRVAGGPGRRLSEERMARVRFVALHPVWDWIYLRHRCVSLLCAVGLLLVVLLGLRGCALFREPPVEESIPIWRMFRSGRLPDLVEQVRKEYEGEGVEQTEESP